MIDGTLHAAGMQEVRENLRSQLDLIRQGSAVAILQHGSIVAVMLDEEEVDQCRHAEYALSTLHGMGVYPEAARDTSELAALVQQGAEVAASVIDELAARPREIMGLRESANASEFRHDLTRYIGEITAGQPQIIVRDGRFAVTLVSGREFDRLGQLRRIMRWFEGAGLDLAKANPPEITAFVEAFRKRPDMGVEGQRAADSREGEDGNHDAAEADGGPAIA